MAAGFAAGFLTACGPGGASPRYDRLDRLPVSPGRLTGSNVLLVTFDTTRADHVGAYGGEAPTPAFDDLARRGVMFENAVATAPVTLPSHASILTGLYPVRHGVRANNSFRLADDQETLAEILLGHGYATGAFVSAFVLDSQFGLDQGFELYDDQMDLPDEERQVWIAERRGDRTTERALAFLREHADERFFLWVHLYDPHHPYRPPDDFGDGSSHPYDGEIAFADAQLGKLMTALDELDLDDRTLVIAAGDHGEGLGQHGERTHATLVYHSTQHVPLALRAGERLRGGLRVDRWVSLVDLAPTVLSLLGIPAPEGLDGVDLTQPPGEPRPLALETLQGLTDQGWAALLGVQVGPLKLIHGPDAELYDLADDPLEERDLRASRPELVATLLDRVRQVFGDDLELATSAAPTHQVSAEDLAKLQALGYLGGGGGELPPPAARPHPRDMAPLLSELESAMQLAATQGPQASVEALERLVRAHPDFATAYQILGFAYARSGSPEKAEAALARHLELRPDDPGPLLQLASLKLSQGRRGDAQEILRQVISRWPDQMPAIYLLGRLLLENGEVREASSLLLRGLETRPDDATVPDLLTDALLSTGRAGELIARFRSMLGDDPDLPMVSNGLARALASRQQYAEAIAALESAIALAPDSFELTNNLAFLRVSVPDLELHRPWDAAVMMERVCTETGYREPRYMHTLSLLWARLGRLDEAIQLAERARRIAQDSPRPAFVGLVDQLDASLGAYRALRDQGRTIARTFRPPPEEPPAGEAARRGP